MENYSLLMGDSSIDEDGGGVDGEAFRGHFPVPAACRNRDSCPPDLGFAMAAALEGFSYRGFFVSKFLGQGHLNRRIGGVGGGLGPPHSRGRAWLLGRAAHTCGPPMALLWSLSGVLEASWNYKMLGVDFVQFREYFLTRISETKNSIKQELALRHLVNRLVPENA